jgi:hypothetical protein
MRVRTAGRLVNQGDRRANVMNCGLIIVKCHIFVLGRVVSQFGPRIRLSLDSSSENVCLQPIPPLQTKGKEWRS